MILQAPESELRRLRRQRGLTLEAVAYLAGDIDIATVSRIERGLVEPRRETVVRLAHAYGMSVRRMAAVIAAEDDGAPGGDSPTLRETSRRMGGGDGCAV